MSFQDQINAFRQGSSIVQKIVTIGDISREFFFKKLPYRDSQRIGVIPFSIDDNGKSHLEMEKLVDRNAAFISASLCDASGGAVLNPQEVGDLPTDLALEFLKAANEVNGFADKAVESATKNSGATM